MVNKFLLLVKKVIKKVVKREEVEEVLFFFVLDEFEEKNYWFFKVEFEFWYENGVDVKFLIDDLVVKIELELWDGMLVFFCCFLFIFFLIFY